MPDRRTVDLDKEIFAFIRRYRNADAPEKKFEELALKLFAYQYERNDPYRQFCEWEGARPGLVRSWRKIPALPVSAFKELTLTSFPLSQKRKVFKTSGTTQFKRGQHCFDTLKLYEASLLEAFRMYLLPDGAKMDLYVLIQDPRQAPDSSLSYMISVVERVYGQKKTHYYLKRDEADFGSLVRDLRYAERPAMLLATAFSLKAFLDYLRNENIWLNLPEGSRLMETGGFKGRTQELSKEAIYGICGAYLGVPRTHCVSEYGMTELSSQAYDTTLAGYVSGQRRVPFKKGPAWMRTLVIDLKTGQEAKPGKKGLLVHFDLANRGSVMAVQTEDLGVRLGDGFEILGRLKGSELRGCSLDYESFIQTA